MLRERKVAFDRILLLNDIILTFCSLLAAYYFRFGIEDASYFFFRTEYAVFFPSYLVIWTFLSERIGLHKSKRIVHFKSEVWDVCKTTMTCIILAMIPVYFIWEYPLSWWFLIYLWMIQTTFLILIRFNLRLFLKHIRKHGFNHRYVLIIGNNERAKNIAHKIDHTAEYGLSVMGYIDIENGRTENYLSQYPLLGNIDALEHILREKVIDTVLITLPLKSFYIEIEKIISICETVGVETEMPVKFFNPKISKSILSTFEDIMLINFYTGPRRINWGLTTKRILDLLLSSFLIIVLLPLLVCVTIIIKVTSEGPVFFLQPRIGYNGRIFTLYKFRTMVKDAESMKNQLADLNELDGPVFKIKNDPRMTTVGRFLRKTSIDELPQLLNVLLGDMSLVGPRPPVPGEVKQYRLTDRRRLSIRPGITGLWQVSGRNNVNFDKWMELDREYIDKWSLWLDLKILLKTIAVVLSTKSAY